MEHRLVLLQAAKQLLASSHLLHIFIIIEAPFQHLKDDRFHKLGDQCIYSRHWLWESSVLHHIARPLPNQQVLGELRALSSTHSSAAPLMWHGTAQVSCLHPADTPVARAAWPKALCSQDSQFEASKCSHLCLTGEVHTAINHCFKKYQTAWADWDVVATSVCNQMEMEEASSKKEKKKLTKKFWGSIHSYPLLLTVLPPEGKHLQAV